MGRRNSFAAKMVCASAALRADEKQAIVRQVTDKVFMLASVALNEEFGFGPDRQERFRSAFEREVLQYGDLMSDADADYADGKLEQSYIKNTRKKETAK